MHFPFIFDSFISHIHGLFCSNVVKGIKCTVVPFCSTKCSTILLSFQPSWLKIPFFPLVLPTLQTIRHVHCPLSKISFPNSTIISLSQEKMKSKKQKAKAPAEEWWEGLFLFCTVSYGPSFSLLLGGSQDHLSLWEQRAWHFQGQEATAA